MAEAESLSEQDIIASPDYERLVRFLLEPLLESPDALCVDCENFKNQPKVWLRLAFEQTDKGRAFGRGGRNLQAIKTLVETTAMAAGKTLYLDVHGVQPDRGERPPEGRSQSRDRGSRPTRPSKNHS